MLWETSEESIGTRAPIAPRLVAVVQTLEAPMTWLSLGFECVTSTTAVFALFGVAGGALTTVAGMGGGLFLVLSLSLLTNPTQALAITAPALLLSNAHRAVLFRRELEGRIALRFAAGAAPAALLAGSAISRLPQGVVQAAMLALTSLALLRARGIVSLSARPRAFVPLSALVGGLSAAAGAGGFLVAPLLFSLGLTGSRYIATGAACAVVLHVARVAGYGVGGLLTTSHWSASAWLFVGLAAGNVLGRRLRGKVTRELETRLELGALIVCTTLGVLGVGLR